MSSHLQNGAAKNRLSKELLDRAPPSDQRAEQGLIASILIEPARMSEVDGLPSTAFHDADHRAVWRAILAINGRGQRVDKILLLAELDKQNPADSTHWEGLLAKALSGEAISANSAHYADVIRDRAVRRQLIHIGEEMFQEANSSSDLSEAILEAAEKQLAEIRVGTDASGKMLTYRRLTCAELDAAEYKTEYLVEWLLVAGQPCIVAGQKKALKTSILLDLAIALAIAGWFLGFFRVTRTARVCVMTGESGLATIQETLRRIAAAANYRLAEIDNLFVSDQLPMFGDLEHLDALKRLLMEDAIEVLILDPAYLCIPADGNEGSLFAMGQLLRGLSEMCQSLGVTLVLAHHTKRGVADLFAPPELEDIAWAGFQEFARQWILLGRKVRYEPGSGIHQLWMNVGGSAGHSSMWALAIAEGTSDESAEREWHVKIVKAEEARRELEDQKEQAKQQKLADQLRRDANALSTAMGKWPQGETLNVLKAAAGLNGTRANLALKVVLDEGDAVPCPVIKGNHKTPSGGYKLKVHADQSDHSDKAVGQAGPTADHHQSDSSPIRGCPSPTGGNPKKRATRTCPSGRRKAAKQPSRKSPDDS